MLKNGRLVALDEKEHLLSLDSRILLWLQLGSDTLPQMVQPLFLRQQENGVVLQLENFEQIEQILHHLALQQIKIEKMQILQNDLEDVFLRLTHDEASGV